MLLEANTYRYRRGTPCPTRPPTGPKGEVELKRKDDPIPSFGSGRWSLKLPAGRLQAIDTEVEGHEWTRR